MIKHTKNDTKKPVHEEAREGHAEGAGGTRWASRRNSLTDPESGATGQFASAADQRSRLCCGARTELSAQPVRARLAEGKDSDCDGDRTRLECGLPCGRDCA